MTIRPVLKFNKPIKIVGKPYTIPYSQYTSHESYKEICKNGKLVYKLLIGGMKDLVSNITSVFKNYKVEINTKYISEYNYADANWDQYLFNNGGRVLLGIQSTQENSAWVIVSSSETQSNPNYTTFEDFIKLDEIKSLLNLNNKVILNKTIGKHSIKASLFIDKYSLKESLDEFNDGRSNSISIGGISYDVSDEDAYGTFDEWKDVFNPSLNFLKSKIRENKLKIYLDDYADDNTCSILAKFN